MGKQIKKLSFFIKSEDCWCCLARGQIWGPSKTLQMLQGTRLQDSENAEESDHYQDSECFGHSDDSVFQKILRIVNILRLVKLLRMQKILKILGGRG